jgi:hypothetical protein
MKKQDIKINMKIMSNISAYSYNKKHEWFAGKELEVILILGDYVTVTDEKHEWYTDFDFDKIKLFNN